MESFTKHIFVRSQNPMYTHKTRIKTVHTWPTEGAIQFCIMSDEQNFTQNQRLLKYLQRKHWQLILYDQSRAAHTHDCSGAGKPASTMMTNLSPLYVWDKHLQRWDMIFKADILNYTTRFQKAPKLNPISLLVMDCSLAPGCNAQHNRFCFFFFFSLNTLPDCKLYHFSIQHH